MTRLPPRPESDRRDLANARRRRCRQTAPGSLPSPRPAAQASGDEAAAPLRHDDQGEGRRSGTTDQKVAAEERIDLPGGDSGGMRLDMRVGWPLELDQYVRGGFLPGDTIGRATLRASGGSFIMPGHGTQTQVVTASAACASVRIGNVRHRPLRRPLARRVRCRRKSEGGTPA